MLRQEVKGIIADWHGSRRSYGLSLVVRLLGVRTQKAGIYERSYNPYRPKYDLLVIISLDEAEEILKDYERYRVSNHIWS